MVTANCLFNDFIFSPKEEGLASEIMPFQNQTTKNPDMTVSVYFIERMICWKDLAKQNNKWTTIDVKNEIILSKLYEIARRAKNHKITIK